MAAPRAHDARARVVLSNATKLEALERLDRGETQASIAERLGVDRTTVSKWKKGGEALREAVAASPALANFKRQRQAEQPKLEAALLEWLASMRANNIPVSGLLLQETARQLAVDAGIAAADFHASDGWLAGFKARHNLLRLKLTGEADSVDKQGAHTAQATLQEELKAYLPANAWNTDETGLYFRCGQYCVSSYCT